jgi:hypothetical protein
MPDLDLFAAVEPRTCGGCGACDYDSTGDYFCALSYKTIRETDAACGPWWYPRAEKG